jgi:hypothetical protein
MAVIFLLVAANPGPGIVGAGYPPKTEILRKDVSKPLPKVAPGTLDLAFNYLEKLVNCFHAE